MRESVLKESCPTCHLLGRCGFRRRDGWRVAWNEGSVWSKFCFERFFKSQHLAEDDSHRSASNEIINIDLNHFYKKDIESVEKDNSLCCTCCLNWSVCSGRWSCKNKEGDRWTSFSYCHEFKLFGRRAFCSIGACFKKKKSRHTLALAHGHQKCEAGRVHTQTDRQTGRHTHAHTRSVLYTTAIMRTHCGDIHWLNKYSVKENYRKKSSEKQWLFLIRCLKHLPCSSSGNRSGMV